MEAEKFRELCYAGLKARGLADKPEYRAQLEQELDVVTRLGFIDYYCIVHDLVHWARSQGIPVGPGRGSAAGALISYCLEITDVDPIKYRLYFERFLNPARVSPPDIDVDFSRRRRDEVIAYLRQRYGEDHVAQIATYGKLLARQAVRDAGRILDRPYMEMDRLAKLVPPPVQGRVLSWEEIYQTVPELKALREQEDPVLLLAERLTGKERLMGVHAAGVVITDEPITECLPLARAKGAVITQWDLKDLETLGFVKFDILALKNLDVIVDCVALIEKRHGIKIDWRRLPEKEDPQVFEYLKQGHYAGIFQLEATAGMRRLVMEMMPQSIEDLAAAVALYRPGPLGSGMHERYVAVKHGREHPVYLTPELMDILSVTYGQLIYQEQVMEVCRTLAGYSMAEADLMRRAIGKKKADEMEQQRQRFVEGMVERGYDRAIAEALFQHIESYAGYGFNKAHAVSYAFITYQTAWLKTHYRQEFYTALLNNTRDASEREKFFSYLVEMRTEDIRLLPPDINHSEVDFTLEDDGIRYGLAGIRDIGVEAAQEICRLRQQAGGRFTSIQHFLKTIYNGNLNAKVLEALALAGCLDSFGLDRQQAAEVCKQGVEALRKREHKLATASRRYEREKERVQALAIEKPKQHGGEKLLQKLQKIEERYLQDKESAESLLENLYHIPPPESVLVDTARLRLEKEYLGFYFSGHPTEKYYLPEALTVTQFLVQAELGRVYTVLGVIHNLKKRLTRAKALMYTLLLEDKYCTVHVTVFPKVVHRVEHLLREQQVVLVRGRAKLRDAEAMAWELVASDILLPDESAMTSMPEKVRFLAQRNLAISQWQSLKDILLRHPGTTKVEIALSHHRGLTVWRLPYAVNPMALPLADIRAQGFEYVEDQ